MGHKMRGENFAFFMLSILEDALWDISPTVRACGQRNLQSLTPVQLRQIERQTDGDGQLSNTMTASIGHASHIVKNDRQPIEGKNSSRNYSGNYVDQPVNKFFEPHNDIQQKSSSEVVSRQTQSDSQADMNPPQLIRGPTIYWLYNQTASSLINIMTTQRKKLSIGTPIICYKEECLSDAYCFTNFEPRVSNSLISRIVGGMGNWTLELSFFDK
jgi:hypothetical protein